MADWACRECRAQVAPGAPRCPECPSTEFIKPEAEADMVLKIAKDGSVSDSANVPVAAAAAELPAPEAVEPLEYPGTGEEMHGIEVPADGTAAEVSNDAAPGAPEPEQVTQLPPGETAVLEPISHAPVAPPRRTPPKAADGS